MGKINITRRGLIARFKVAINFADSVEAMVSKIHCCGIIRPKTTVLCHGCFDLFHVGHLHHLEEAAGLGDELVVSVTADKYVNKGKGRPIFNQNQRLEMVMEISWVWYGIISNSAAEAILKVKPDIYVKGPDYKYSMLLDSEKKALKKVGAKFVTTKAKKLSTTDIIKRIKECQSSS